MGVGFLWEETGVRGEGGLKAWKPGHTRSHLPLKRLRVHVNGPEDLT